MMLVGGVLNANTVLQPQFMQQLLGYTATTAGLALTAGGVTLVVMMPLAGFATGKFSARTLAVCRLHPVRHHLPLRGRRHQPADELCRGVLAARRADDAAALLLHLHHHRGLRRHAQGREQPGCRPHQLRPQHRRQHPHRHHQRAGHQPRHVARAAPAAGHAAGLHRLPAARAMRSPAFFGGSFGGPNGGGMALATIYNQLNQQAQMQGYQDVYMELSCMSIVLIVLAFLLSKNRPGAGSVAAAPCTESLPVTRFDPLASRVQPSSRTFSGSPAHAKLHSSISALTTYSLIRANRPIIRGRKFRSYFEMPVFLTSADRGGCHGEIDPCCSWRDVCLLLLRPARAPARNLHRRRHSCPRCRAGAAEIPSSRRRSPRPRRRRFIRIDCAVCHGDNGNGKTDLATSMSLTLTDWTDPKSLADKSDGDLFKIIRDGKGTDAARGRRPRQGRRCVEPGDLHPQLLASRQLRTAQK